MQRWILRLVINALALYVAVGSGLVAGIEAESNQPLAFLGLAVVFTVVNALVRPVLKLLSCPLILLTLGLFILVVNGVIFWLTGLIGQTFDIGFTVEGFWPAFWGGLVVGLVNAAFTLVVRKERHRK
jgi:putative membrane protein